MSIWWGIKILNNNTQMSLINVENTYRKACVTNRVCNRVILINIVIFTGARLSLGIDHTGTNFFEIIRHIIFRIRASNNIYVTTLHLMYRVRLNIRKIIKMTYCRPTEVNM